jgi:hypothetical protein
MRRVSGVSYSHGVCVCVCKCVCVCAECYLMHRVSGIIYSHYCVMLYALPLECVHCTACCISPPSRTAVRGCASPSPRGIFSVLFVRQVVFCHCGFFRTRAQSYAYQKHTTASATSSETDRHFLESCDRLQSRLDEVHPCRALMSLLSKPRRSNRVPVFGGSSGKVSRFPQM